MKNQEPIIYSVSDLNAMTRQIIEECFPSIWVSGEISNCVRPASGHIYFSLKDERAQIRCAFFRNARRPLKFMPENGQQVMVRGQVSLYEPRGDYQLIANEIELAGEGALQLAFIQLKSKLEKAGLFDAQFKKPLPLLPKQIGVITSSTGAAIRDVLIVLKRRFAGIPIVIYPSLVQGAEASGQIVKALNLANERHECDVLLLVRGGGSLEDLWPFNEEAVAQAIFASQIPIVSGIGHEVDFTIADFVADLRAATPSAAAECVSPNRSDVLTHFAQYQQRLAQITQRLITQARFSLESLQKQLRHPKQLLQQQAQRLDNFEQQLQHLIKFLIEKKSSQLKQDSIRLNTLNPLNTLARGFAIVEKDAAIIRDAAELKKGDLVTTRLSKGSFTALVR